ncbi:unnamed protein product, partial [Owenia fusiformis]
LAAKLFDEHSKTTKKTKVKRYCKIPGCDYYTKYSTGDITKHMKARHSMTTTPKKKVVKQDEMPITQVPKKRKQKKPTTSTPKEGGKRHGGLKEFTKKKRQQNHGFMTSTPKKRFTTYPITSTPIATKTLEEDASMLAMPESEVAEIPKQQTHSHDRKIVTYHGAIKVTYENIPDDHPILFEVKPSREQLSTPGVLVDDIGSVEIKINNKEDLDVIKLLGLRVIRTFRK